MKSLDELLMLITRRGVHEVFGAYGEGWGIEQNAEELARFLVEMQRLSIESVLEIGTGWKAGLARFLHDDLGWRVTSVDIHDYGHQFEGITFVTGLDKIEGYFDLVIIDADHHYESVKRDHSVWGLHATQVIAFHDIAGLRECEGVREYWREISRDPDYPPEVTIAGYHEIIAEGDQRGGIGYVVLEEAAVNDEHPLLDALHTDKPKASEPHTAKKPSARKTAPAKKAAAKK